MKPKVKVSISLSNELLDAIDREAKRTAESRSRIIEIWLQLASRRRAARQLEEQTIAYYQNRSPEQREDDEAWGQLSARTAASLQVDEAPRKARSRGVG
jgi:metal-responsive CopG/Arc/MetJ family transcriptional regulator